MVSTRSSLVQIWKLSHMNERVRPSLRSKNVQYAVGIERSGVVAMTVLCGSDASWTRRMFTMFAVGYIYCPSAIGRFQEFEGRLGH